MRRKERARMDQEFIDAVLNDAQEIYIAFSTEQAPYILPLNFAYLQGKIYFHCAFEGRKIDCLKLNNKVGFSTAIDIEILREKATTTFRSICGSGVAHIISDPIEKGAALDAIALRYAAKCEVPATARMIERTAIIRIDIEEVCGKENPITAD